MIGADVPRNALCPCGSGMRYKACHGRVGAAPVPAIDPEAALDLAMKALDRGHAIEAVSLLAPVASRLRSGAVPEAFARRFWQQYAFMLGEAAARVDSRRPAGDAAPADGAIDARTPITVAIVVGPRTTRWREAIASVGAQTHAPTAVLVVDLGGTDANAIDVALAALPWPAQRIAVAVASTALAVDAALTHACEGAVALLDGDHAFGPQQLAKLVAAAERDRRTWAFGRVDVVDASGAVLAADRDGGAEYAARRASDADVADSVGSAFVGARFPLVVDTNLLVSRALAARVGRCAGRGPLWAWSLALDLLLVAEPAYADDASYRVPAGDPALARQLDEEALAALFRGYYARALAPAPPPNPLAPSPHTHGDAFFRQPLQQGHVLLFDPRAIDALVTRVLLWAETSEPRRRGVTLAGFAFGEFGLGENLRAIARACAAADVPFDVRDVGLGVSSRQRDRSMAPYVASGYARAITVLCVNPDQLPQIDELIDHARRGGGRVAGFWFWELDRVPRTWEPWVERFDEIWVATSFVAGAVRAVTDRPVVVVPTPVEVGRVRDYRRSEFGVPDDTFAFLFTFDYNSQPVRKNAIAVVDAFRRAFPPGRRDVALVIKSSNARRFPEHHAALVARIGGDDRIVAFDRYLSRDAVWGLQSVCDCYVSLHRSEGLGLGLAESMLQGKPAIATRWSGNLDFMTPDNSALVDCTFVPVGEGEYPASNPGQQWAEPDAAQAVIMMQRMVDDRTWRETLATRGQRDVRERLSSVSTAARVRARLEAVGAL
jgi:glycosyltransferase involved in cell wall biosynthesis